MLDLFEVFLHVADRGSFIDAARAMGVVPSTISKKVSALETQLGVTVFQRTTRSLSLTQEGRIVYDEARQILSRVDALEARLATQTAEALGTLKISTFPEFGRLLLGRHLPEFHRRYPRIKTELSISEDIVDLIGDSFDVAIRFGVLPDSELQARILGDYDYYLCVSPRYVAEHGAPTRLEDLSQHVCMTDPTSPLIRTWVFERDGERVEVIPEGPLQADDPITRYFATVEGLGISVLPAVILRDAVKAGQLQLLFPEHPIRFGKMWAIHARRDPVPKRIQLFVDFARELAQSAQTVEDMQP